MKTIKYYEESPKKAAIADSRFKYVMAVALDSSTDYKKGLIRCIVERQGEVTGKFYDRSELHLVNNSSGEFEIGERVPIKNEEKIIASLCADGGDFIGLEDPDIYIDENGLKHVYFTIPIRYPKTDDIKIHLGHAVGRDLESLVMTEPSLLDNGKTTAKELSIAPLNSQGVRLNLIESSDVVNDTWYSTVMSVVAEDMGKPWKFKETLIHPAERKIPWLGEDASPGPLLPKDFVDVGENKLLGILNGRSAKKKIGGKIKRGKFTVGLFIYNFEEGKIEWISENPLIEDSEAKIITFASQFVPTGKGAGVLYAHVDDSFVRAYTLNAEEVSKFVNSNR